MKEEVVLFIEGHGFGHASRMLSVIEELKPRIISFKDGARFLKGHKIKFVEIKQPYSLEFNDKELDIIQTMKSLRKAFEIKSLSLITKAFRKAKVVVIDSSLLAFALAKLLKKPTILITNNTNPAVFAYGNKKFLLSKIEELLSLAEELLIPDFPLPYTISYKNISIKKSKLNYNFIGPLVYLKDIKGKKKARLSFIHSFERSLYKKVEDVKFSMLAKNYDGGNIKKVENIREYMKSSEVLVHHGGHSSTMESIMLGKPQIAIPNPNYGERINNAKGIEKQNVGKALFSNYLEKEVFEIAVEEALEKKKQVERMKKLGKKMRAKERVIDKINAFL